VLAALIVSSSIMTTAIALYHGSAIRRSILAWLSTGRDMRFTPRKLAFLTLSAFLSHWGELPQFRRSKSRTEVDGRGHMGIQFDDNPFDAADYC
jgi:hypothetical protein